MMSNERNHQLYLEVGRRISNFRNIKKISQQKMAEDCHLDRTSIINIEKGRQRVPIDRLYTIADILGIDLKELLPAQHEMNQIDAVSLNRVSPEAMERIKDIVKESQTK